MKNKNRLSFFVLIVFSLLSTITSLKAQCIPEIEYGFLRICEPPTGNPTETLMQFRAKNEATGYCRDDEVEFSVSNATPGSTYNWEVHTATGTVNYSGNPVTITFGVVGAVEVCVTQTTPSGCEESDCLMLEVAPPPTATFEAIGFPGQANITTCKGNTLFFLDNGSSSNSSLLYLASWNWEVKKDGLSVMATTQNSASAPFSFAFNEAGSYEVILTVENCFGCSATYSVMVEVGDTEACEIICPSVICEGDEVAYTADCDCANYYWTFSIDGMVLQELEGNPVNYTWSSLPAQHSGYGLVTLNTDGCSPEGCSEPSYFVIPILPIEGQIDGPNAICGPGVYQYNLPQWPGASYNWEIQGAPTGAEFLQSYNTAILILDDAFNGSFTIEVEVDHGFAMCGFETAIEVNAFDYEISGATDYCFGEKVMLTIAPAPPTDGELVWYVFDDENNAVTSCTPSDIELVCSDLPAGSYQVFYGVVLGATTFNCFENPFVFTIDQPVPPVEDMEVMGEREICTETMYTYTVDNMIPNSILEWQIVGGAPAFSIGNEVTVIWMEGAPVYQLEITRILGDCSSETLTVPIGIQPEPTVTIAGEPTACRDSRHVYQAMADGVPLLDAEDYSWNIIPDQRGTIVSGADGPEIEVEWHPGTSSTVKIRLTAEVCGVDYTTEFEVAIIGSPELVFDVPQEVCVDESFTLSANYLTNTLNIADATVSWTLEDGTVIGTQPEINHVFEEEGSQLIQFTISDIENCPGTATFFHTINVLPNPRPFITTPDNLQCPACESPTYSTTITLYTQSTVGFSYQWEYRSIGGSWTNVGTNSPELIVNIDNSLPNSGTGDYRVTVSNGGCANTSELIAIDCECSELCDQNPPVTVDFDWSFSSECGTIDLVGDITPFDPSLYQMFWTIQKSPEVEVVVSNASAGSYTLSGFQIPVNNPADLFQRLSFSVPGFYPIRLNVVEIGQECGPVHTEVAEIPVIADFRQFVACGSDEGIHTFTFTDQSEVLTADAPGNIPINYSTSWEVRNGTAVVDEGIGSEFTTDLEEGITYTVCLKVQTDYTNNGSLAEPYACEYCTTIEIPVFLVDFTYAPQPACHGSPIQFTPIVNPDDVIEYHWEVFFSGSSFPIIESFLPEPNFSAVVNMMEVKLTATSRLGCQKTVSYPIETGASFIFGFIQGALNVCNTESEICFNSFSSTPIAFYEWSTGESGEDLDCITVGETGNYVVTITDENGCSRDFDANVIFPFVELAVIGDTELCFGEDELIELTANDIPGYTYEWTSSPALTNNSFFQPVFSSTDFEPNTTYQITVALIRSDMVCLEETIEVMVHPKPNFTLSVSYNCGPPYNAIIEALDDSGNPVAVNWYQEGDFIENATTLQTIFGGTYSAELVNEMGCRTILDIEVEGQTDFSSLLFGCYEACREDLDGSICIPGIPGQFSEWEWMYLLDGEPTSFDPLQTGINTVSPLCLTEDLIPEEGTTELEVVLRVVGNNGCENTSEPICFELENCIPDCDITITSSGWCGNVCLDFSEYANISVNMRGPDCGPGYARFTVLTPGEFYNLNTGNTATSVIRNFIFYGTSTFPTLRHWYRAGIFLPFNDLNDLEENCFLVELFDENDQLFHTKEVCFDIVCPRGEFRSKYQYSECVDLPPTPARDQVIIRSTGKSGGAWISYPDRYSGDGSCTFVKAKIFGRDCCREGGEGESPDREICFEATADSFYIDLNDWHASCAELTVFKITPADENNIIRLAEGCLSLGDLDNPKKALIKDLNQITVAQHPEPVIFPNPNNGRFTLSNSGEGRISGFSIYNSQLQEVQTFEKLAIPATSNFEFDLGAAPDGIYFIAIRYSDATQHTLKFIKL